MADSVAYRLDCTCGETIYAAHVPRNPLAGTPQETEYYPDTFWPNCHDPITHCRRCGRKITDVEGEQYDAAMEQLP